MKKLIALAVLTSALAAHAQWTVFDPTMNVQQIIDTAQQLAKYAVMINNQVQQIQTLNAQLTEFKKYEAVFGNPASTSAAHAANHWSTISTGRRLARLSPRCKPRPAPIRP